MTDETFESMEKEHNEEMRAAGCNVRIFLKMAEPLIERSRLINRTRPALCFYICGQKHLWATDGKNAAFIALDKIGHPLSGEGSYIYDDMLARFVKIDIDAAPPAADMIIPQYDDEECIDAYISIDDGGWSRYKVQRLMEELSSGGALFSDATLDLLRAAETSFDLFWQHQEPPKPAIFQNPDRGIMLVAMPAIKFVRNKKEAGK